MNSIESDSEDIMKIINKKFLINEWRDITQQKVSGIYKIVNKINGKYYVGSSKNILGENGRWSDHYNDLIKNAHYNTHLQRAWNKYGYLSFDFIIIQLSLLETLLQDEQYYLNIAKCEKHMCYNLRYQASGGDISDETKTKISKSSIKMWSDPIIRKKILSSQFVARKNSNYIKNLKEANNKSWTDERKTKQSKLAKSRWDINKQRMGGNGISHPRYDNTTYTFINNDKNETFVGTKYEFYSKYKLDKSKVYRLLSGERKKHKGWIVKLTQSSSQYQPSFPPE
jgi:group I intron endonuclease